MQKLSRSRNQQETATDLSWAMVSLAPSNSWGRNINDIKNFEANARAQTGRLRAPDFPLWRRAESLLKTLPPAAIGGSAARVASDAQDVFRRHACALERFSRVE
jgi:hypothetical protein